MALTPQQRYELGLDDTPPMSATPAPQPLADGEFLPGPNTRAPDPQHRPNLRLALSPGDRATAPKIRTMVNELLAGNMQEADRALKQLMALNPKEGLRAYTELMSFSMPQLKAMAVAVDDNSGKPHTLSFQQLISIVQGAPEAQPPPEGAPST